MNWNYEELDFRSTPLGDLMLRRRRMVQFPDRDIYEIKLGDDFLMTSLFHEAEEQLAKLAMAAIEKDELDVVVGGLGLGYTAVSALQDARVKSLIVVDYLKAVIEWHENGLLPLGKTLTDDARCNFVHADFFSLSRDSTKGFGVESGGKKHDVILLDIDHTPANVLHPSNSRFYSEVGLAELTTHLNPGGVFGMWADGSPEESFVEHLRQVFLRAEAHTIEFDNPITGGTSKGTVYIAMTTS